MNSDTNTPWQYHSGDSSNSKESPTGQDNTPKPHAPSQQNLTWSAAEYIEREKGAGWYLLLIVITAALGTGVYFFTKDIFATGTIVVVGIIVAIFATRKPQQITYEVSGGGLRIGEKTYRYGLFKSFSVAREGSLSSINLQPLKRFMPPVSAYFKPEQEQNIVNAVGEHLPYEEHKLDSIDRLTRRLRL